MAEWIGVTISAVGAVSTAAGVLAALWQYRRNSLESRRRDRRDELVVALERDGSVRAGPGRQERAGDARLGPAGAQLAMADGTSRAVRVDADLFIAALRSNQAPVHEGWPWLPEEDRHRLAEKAASKGGGFTPEETAIRSAFDRFLDRLERIETLIERDVISAEDFETHFCLLARTHGRDAVGLAQPLRPAQARRALGLYRPLPLLQHAQAVRATSGRRRKRSADPHGNSAICSSPSVSG